ncbi:hypothetical protein LJC32_01375 [Oscillospiraceae bacterium OttesenSCG-928-F05]|nr:hypothetical protein [Oscillospiraceae bacterium OttesenSCG-928-F05]
MTENKNIIEFVCDTCGDDERKNPTKVFNDLLMIKRMKRLESEAQNALYVVTLNGEYCIALQTCMEFIVTDVFDDLFGEECDEIEELISSQDFIDNENKIVAALSELAAQHAGVYFEYTTSQAYQSEERVDDMYIVFTKDVSDETILHIAKKFRSLINRMWINCFIDHDVDIISNCRNSRANYDE